MKHKWHFLQIGVIIFLFFFPLRAMLYYHFYAIESHKSVHFLFNEGFSSVSVLFPRSLSEFIGSLLLKSWIGWFVSAYLLGKTCCPAEVAKELQLPLCWFMKAHHKLYTASNLPILILCSINSHLEQNVSVCIFVYVSVCKCTRVVYVIFKIVGESRKVFLWSFLAWRLMNVIAFINVDKSTWQSTRISAEPSLEVLCIKVIMDFLAEYLSYCWKHRVLDTVSVNFSVGSLYCLLF